MPETTTTTESDPELLELLADAGRRWGPLGVALAAASLTDREALTRKLTGVTAAEETDGDRSDMPLAERITTLVAELARQRDAARRDGAADALTAFAAHLFVLGRVGPEVEEAQLWADQVRSGFRTIPTTEGDHHD